MPSPPVSKQPRPTMEQLIRIKMAEKIAAREALAREHSLNRPKQEHSNLPVNPEPVTSSTELIRSTATAANDETKASANYSGLVAKKRKRPVEENTNGDLHSNSVSTGEPKADVKMSNTQFAPAKKPSRKSAKPVYKSRQVIQLPDWTHNVDKKAKPARRDVDAVKGLRGIIELCIEHQSTDKLNIYLNDLRTKIQDMEHYDPQLLPAIIVQSKVLQDGGLPEVFSDEHAELFPPDIVDDAQALYARWVAGNHDPSLLRGIKPMSDTLASGQKRKSYKLDPTYKFRKSPNVVGNNGLVNGQWWVLRLCALRDGAHGESEAGIHGQPGHGAYSVVVGDKGYADRDSGDVIEYCGTESDTSTPTKGTQLLQESLRLKQPVRVLRGKGCSKYGPKEGLRYDGLYEVCDSEVLKASTAMIRFTLKRVKGQSPIRWKGVEARPTRQELQQRSNIQYIIRNAT